MKSFILVLCTLFLVSCHAAVPSVKTEPVNVAGDEKNLHELTQELMQKCGLNDQIGNVPEKTKVEVIECFKRNEAITGKISDMVVTDINHFISQSFNPDSIRTILSSYIEAQMAPKDIRSVLKWLDSPLGKKITNIEKIASTPEAYHEMLIAMPTLKLTSDYEERLSLVHEIDKSVKATELIVDRTLNMQIITLSAMSNAFPAMNLPSEDIIRANFEKNRNMITDEISREIALSMLFTYRNVSKDDLKTYIRFMKTDYGKRYHEVIQEATNKAYVYCGKKFSDAVVKRISDKTGTPANSDTDILSPSRSYPQDRKR